jgi:hypothetical protein
MLGGIKWIAFVLLICLLISSCNARMGYNIIARAGGNTFEIHRSTQNITFSLNETVNGSGNFSRYSDITGFAGVYSKETSSSAKRCELNYSELIRLIARSGPVFLTTDLESYDLVNDTPLVVPGQEFVNMNIDENWATAYVNYKKISYIGPQIRTYERYDNNGDIVSTYIDSRHLYKENLYRSTYNRTVIDVYLTDTSKNVNQALNRSSYYGLYLQTNGRLAHIGAIKQASSGSIGSMISQDYTGDYTMGLKIKMDGIVHTKNQTAQNSSWLDCCNGGYFSLGKDERKYFSAERIFNCSCENYLANKTLAVP